VGAPPAADEVETLRQLRTTGELREPIKPKTATVFGKRVHVESYSASYREITEANGRNSTASVSETDRELARHVQGLDVWLPGWHGEQ